MTETVHLAVDLGATSGRVIRTRVSEGGVALEHTYRFPNTPVEVWEGEGFARYWDIFALWSGVIEGLRECARGEEEITSIGVDSWAVDYARLSSGRLQAAPYHYRDTRTLAAMERVHAVVSPERLYAINGLQVLPFNTIYQWEADGRAGLLRETDAIALIPDLFGYWLTGQRRAERTNASATGLLDCTTGDWSRSLAAELGIPAAILPDIIEPGTTLGTLLPGIAERTGLHPQTAVIAVASHDTASAIVAVPARSPEFAYISSGTWSLVGLELPAPVLTEASRQANFTNEGGLDGTVRFLRNVAGMWLVSECLEQWRLRGEAVTLGELLPAASAVTDAPVFDANDPVLIPAGDMLGRISRLCAVSGQPVPVTSAQFLRSILDSLALAYARALDQARVLADREVTEIHVVGGGAQNALLCQLTADRTGIPVIAGPVEATALGNALVQARAVGTLRGDLTELRAVVRASITTIRYEPRDR